MASHELRKVGLIVVVLLVLVGTCVYIVSEPSRRRAIQERDEYLRNVQTPDGGSHHP
jgi:hypothetical protein